MAEDKDYLGEKLRLAERAREDVYFRALDQALIAQMQQQARAEDAATAQQQAMFTPILVPVDFSDYATAALRYAASIAERFASSLIVLHVMASETATHAGQSRVGPVVSPRGAEAPPDAEEDVIIDRREQTYAALQAFLPAQLAKHPVELRVVVGHPFERILETAVRAHVALIVLGTHGRTGLSHALMGSVAERVVRLAPCPVLTVKTATVEEKGWLQSVYDQFIL
jgi:nucleotide-binding universal stress UspA family protein